MLKNPVKTLWDEDLAATSGWLHLGHSFAAEIISAQGFDAVVVDHQHAPYGMDTALALISAISRSAASAPMARVAWNDPPEIMKFLDAGALGIICPMVGTAQQAKDFVGACRYPPLGYRSYGPTRAALIHGAEYGLHANDAVLTMAMIETAEGLANIDAILRTPELDGIFVGPSDLNQSLGNGAALDSLELEFLKTLEQIAVKTRAAGKQAGIFCGSAEYAVRMQQLGYRFLVLSSDSRMLAAAARAALETFKAGSSTAFSKIQTGGY